MEFYTDLIRTPKLNNVFVLTSLFERVPVEGTICITGHHLIFSTRRADHPEIWVCRTVLLGINVI